jgi:hypothetical protein
MILTSLIIDDNYIYLHHIFPGHPGGILKASKAHSAHIGPIQYRWIERAEQATMVDLEIFGPMKWDFMIQVDSSNTG